MAEEGKRTRLAIVEGGDDDLREVCLVSTGRCQLAGAGHDDDGATAGGDW